MNFDGFSGRGNVSMGGAGRGRQRPGNESRADFLKRQHKQRDEREENRIRERAATTIQSIFRGWQGRRITAIAHRALFDKRCSDVAKVEKMLQPAQRAAFVFKAILSVIRLFSFFFKAGEDRGRLTRLLELVYFSVAQQPPNNFFALALASDGERRSFLVHFEKLLLALLTTKQSSEVASLLQQFRTVMFTQNQSEVDVAKLGQAVRHVLLRTTLLRDLTAEAMLINPGGASPEERRRASELSLVTCAGIEHCRVSEQRRLMVTLLSSPDMCGLFVGDPPNGPPHELLQRIATQLPPAPDGNETMSLASCLNEEVMGSSRWAWLLGNLAVSLQRLLESDNCATAQIRTGLNWISWVKAMSPIGARVGAYSAQLAVLHSCRFAKSLLQHVDQEDAQGLMPLVLELYFPSAAANPLTASSPMLTSSATPSCSSTAPANAGALGDALPLETPAEALQALAFATTLTQLLLPSMAALASRSSAFDELGAASFFCSPMAARLRAFCAVYVVQLQSMYDAEFFGAANPLRPEEVALLAPALNRLAYRFVVYQPDRNALPPQARSLRSSLTALVRAFYHRHLRRSIIQADGLKDWWLIPEAPQLLQSAPVVDLGTDPAQSANDGLADMDEDEPSPAAAPDRVRRPARLGGNSYAREVLEAVLLEVPHVLQFQDRVALLHNVILADQENREESRAPWARSELRQHQIRRDFLVEDGFAAFASLADEDALRAVFKVEFIAPDGTPESGIDGGGLFKEFMIHICRETFDPKFGLFTSSDDHSLYPAPSAFRAHANASEMYRFLGKVVGKAIYEMFLLEAQFSRVFLNRILGRLNEVDDVAALDRELHRNMLRLKENERIEDIGLTFSISTSQFGHMEDVDLVPNGRNIPVTKHNLTQYLHVVANFRTNLQIQRHTTAFLSGLQCVIPLSWLKMFDPYELNTLVSGSTQGFDVSDLRQHTVYGGGYREDSPVVQWLWALLQSMEPEDMGRFLMFITSCSRPPLLGFKTLYPQFGIHRVPDAMRLPTASTCANLLKLPDYRNPDDLKAKLLEAIRSECGFDLS